MWRQHAFTLIELIVVFVVISILLSMLLPVLKYSQESVRQITCTSNLRQVHMFASFFSQETEEYVPQVFWFDKTLRWLDEFNRNNSLRPNLIDYGLTSTVRMCPTQLSLGSAYGINEHFVRDYGPNVGPNGNWGPGDIYFWVHGWLKIGQVRSSSALAYFAEGSRIPAVPNLGFYRIDPYALTAAGKSWLGYPHGGARTNVAFIDGHVEVLTEDEAFPASEADLPPGPFPQIPFCLRPVVSNVSLCR